MRMVDLIEKKRDGYSLTKEEIRYIIDGYTNDEIPDYQMAALAMAIYFNEMNDDERAQLTIAMAESGDQIQLDEIEGIKVDKHSTGGVGDKTTIALAPLVAAVGVPVPKMSGRGLGHTGGTLDKLESIPGFNIELTSERFIELVNKNKLAVIGQTGNLTPADKKLYALRDVTATVNSIPLIASSIMSKKIAAGADAIVLDVKTGLGAFMKELEDSKALAQAMVSIGETLGRKTMAIISNMDEPLGYAVGNALEIKEAIDFLQGEGPDDLRELCLTLGSQMVYFAEIANSVDEAREKLIEVINNGQALATFQAFIEAQGGDASIISNRENLPKAQHLVNVVAKEAGKVQEIVANEIGVAAMRLGAGRATKDEKIDLGVGVVLAKKVGDKVEKGETLATIHTNSKDIDEIKQIIFNAYSITNDEVVLPPLIYEKVY